MIEENDHAVRRRATKHAKDDKQEIDNALTSLLSTHNGRKLVWHLLTLSKLGQNPHTGEALSTAFNCGELNIGQQLLNMVIEVSPASYIQMQKEQQDEYDRRYGKSSTAGGGAEEPGDGDPANDD